MIRYCPKCLRAKPDGTLKLQRAIWVTVAVEYPGFPGPQKLNMGQRVAVDQIKTEAFSSSGFVLRVVGVWKKPQWLDAGYFREWNQKNEGDK